MHTTANLALTIWDQPTDDFAHDQLASNFEVIDTHDHSPNRGVQIGTAGLAIDAVTQAQLAPNSVGNPQLQLNSVGTPELQAGAVTNPILAPGSVFGNVIPNGAITAPMLDPTIVPLGGVMMWWRPVGANTAPGGFWEAMDGRAWNGITNAFGLTAGTIPDTRGIFIKGADPLAHANTGQFWGKPGPAGAAIGAVGGSISAGLAHSHNVLGHTHTVGSHGHGISTDGSHFHLWQGGLHMGSRSNCLPIGMTVLGAGGGSAGDTFYSTYIQNLLSNPFWGGPGQNLIDGQADMDNAGAHAHGGSTAASGAFQSGSAGAGTDTQLSSTAIDPPWLGLMLIMRCR